YVMLSMVLSALLKFPDVPSDYWAYPAITVMASAGVLHGYRDGRFMPTQALSREQAAAILARVEGLSPVSLPAVADAGQVSPSLSGDVGAAYAAGFIRGTAQGLLNPLGVVTRAEAAAMVARAFQLTVPSSRSSAGFRDEARIPSYALADVV
ncbi:S-layer domain-containing protein, partial [mine drainage metagenome]